MFKYSKIDKKLPGILFKEGEAGYDLYALKDKWIFPLVVRKIPLNIKTEFPKGKFGFVTSRSGCSLNGLFVIPGIIDWTYRGTINAIVVKIGFKPMKIKKGTRICQIILLTNHSEEPIEVEEDKLTMTSRGSKGFGSSGER